MREQLASTSEADKMSRNGSPDCWATWSRTAPAWPPVEPGSRLSHGDLLVVVDWGIAVKTHQTTAQGGHSPIPESVRYNFLCTQYLRLILAPFQVGHAFRS